MCGPSSIATVTASVTSSASRLDYVQIDIEPPIVGETVSYSFFVNRRQRPEKAPFFVLRQRGSLKGCVNE
jgi:hypothetical protein